MLQELVNQYTDPWMWILAGCAAALFVWSLSSIIADMKAATPSRREGDFGERVTSPLLKIMIMFGRPLGLQIVRPLAKRAERKFEETGQESFLLLLRHRLAMDLRAAGNPEGMSPDEFLGLSLFAMIFFSMLGYTCYLMYPVAFLVLIFPFLGAVMPRFWLTDLVRKRRKEIRKTLPYALDLLTLAVEAGLDFTTALARITERMGNTPLATEFRTLLQEIQMGKIRSDALRDMANRVSVYELTSVVSALVQTDELGAPLGPVLRIQAEFIRTRRAQEAEEQAMKAPVKLLFPLILFIFPTAFLMIFGPIFLKYKGVFGL